MTLEETRQAAAVMLAYAEGKPIQWRDAEDESDQWEICEIPLWNWDVWEYRVAPERWAGKIWVHPDGRVVHDYGEPPEILKKHGWRLIEAKEVEP